MTPFEQALQQVREGELQTPSVSVSGKRIDYFGYQLAVHKFNLGIMAGGIGFHNIKFTDIKRYYGLKGRTAKACIKEFNKMI